MSCYGRAKLEVAIAVSLIHVLCSYLQNLINLHTLLCLHQSLSADGQPVCLSVRHPSATHDQILIIVRELCFLTRERVYSLQLLLDLASAATLGSESRLTHNHSLLSLIR
jgi:hypothetical protein